MTASRGPPDELDVLVAVWRVVVRARHLAGDRKGQHSIRINDQWRICFLWHNGGAESVEIRRLSLES
jgi:plasmid maintenance system killer protein